MRLYDLKKKKACRYTKNSLQFNKYLSNVPITVLNTRQTKKHHKRNITIATTECIVKKKNYVEKTCDSFEGLK